MFTPSDEPFVCRKKYKMYEFGNCSETLKQKCAHFPDKKIGAADLRST